MAKPFKKHIGVGDTIEWFLHLIRADKVVDKFTNKGGCGCKSRRNKLNKKYPYTWKTS